MPGEGLSSTSSTASEKTADSQTNPADDNLDGAVPPARTVPATMAATPPTYIPVSPLIPYAFQYSVAPFTMPYYTQSLCYTPSVCIPGAPYYYFGPRPATVYPAAATQLYANSGLGLYWGCPGGVYTY